MSSKRSRKPHPQNIGGGHGDGSGSGSGSGGGGFMGFGSVVKTCTSNNEGNDEGDVNPKHGGEILCDIYR